MFDKKEKDKKEEVSIISNGMKVEGSITCTGRLVINGNVKGTLNGEEVVIGKDGSVFADMTVSRITIGGKFDGKIDASGELVIRNGGDCSGSLVCKDLVVEPGGLINAEISCLPEKYRDAAKHQAVKSKKNNAGLPNQASQPNTEKSGK